MTASDTYRQLREYLVETAILGSTGSLLGWDELTYMPPRGAEGRSRQSSLIARMVHERFVASDVGHKLEELQARATELEPDAAANVKEWLRQYRREARVPAALVEEMSRTAVLSRQAWGEARAKNEYALFRPWLERTLSQQRQLAACVLGHEPANADELYDALLDAYEPYETSGELRAMFAQLRPELVTLINSVKGTSRGPSREIMHRHYPAGRQRQLGEEAARCIGFDASAGRLDTTVHPFCTTISAGDVRITTRYDEGNFANCFFSVIHETGHALYEQGLPPEAWGTPCGSAVSLGVHESQSRFWENLVCRGEGFWKFWYPRTRELFPEALGGVEIEQFAGAVNTIEPSLIRTEADEATYNLHIILRFELELALLGKSLSTSDLPGAWNQKMHELLGVTVPDNRLGCLQDVHWSQGGFGYFPTYTLGNLNAAALMESAAKDLPDLDGQIERGEFAPLLAWLREKVHRHGSRYTPKELIQRATGASRTIQPLMRHLNRKAERWYL